MSGKNDFRQKLVDDFIRSLEEAPEEWQKMWSGPQGIPYNGSSGRKYHGINRLVLQFLAYKRGYADPRWYTFNQASNHDLHIKRGSKGTKVEYWFMWDTENKKSVTPNEYMKLTDEQKDKIIWTARYYTVFNGDQLDGLEPYKIPEHPDIQPSSLLETISQNMKVDILNDGGDRAYYSPKTDTIHLPLPTHFFSEYAYNSTALHEIAHATGHESRLNRLTDAMFGSEQYAREELVAELTSCFMGAEIGIEQTEEHIKNHKAYIQSWISDLKEKPDILIKAVKKAEEAAAYISKAAGLEYEKAETAELTGSGKAPVKEEAYQHSRRAYAR